MFILSNFIRALAQVLDILLNIYLWMVIISVLLSWIPIPGYNPTVKTILQFLRNVTEPVFTFIRRKLQLHRYASPIDFSPLIVIILIYFLQNFVVRSLVDIALALR